MRACRHTGETKISWAAGEKCVYSTDLYSLRIGLAYFWERFYYKIVFALKNALLIIFSTGRLKLISFCPESSDVKSHYSCVILLSSKSRYSTLIKLSKDQS